MYYTLFDIPVNNDFKLRFEYIEEHIKGRITSSYSIYKSVLEGITVLQFEELFHNMTEHEVTVFLEILEVIDESNTLIYFSFKQEKNETIRFVKLLLICAIFPSFIKGSFLDALKTSRVNEYLDINVLFDNLFKKYSISEDFKITYSRGYLIKMSELDVFNNRSDFFLYFSLLQGKNIRKIHNTPYNISKKESFFFHFKNNLFYPKNGAKNYIKQRIVAAKLAIGNEDKIDQIKFFLEANFSFNYDVDSYYKQIMFWRKGFELLPLELTEQDLRAYVDFLQHQIQNPNFNLKGQTFVNLQKQIISWHENISIEEEKNNDIYWGTEEEAITKTIAFHNEIYVYRKIINSYDLYLEGFYKKHCVYFYKRYCISGKIEVYTLSKENENRKKGLTIEVSNKKMIQALGRFNKRNVFLEKNIVPLFAEKENIKILN